MTPLQTNSKKKTNTERSLADIKVEVCVESQQMINVVILKCSHVEDDHFCNDLYDI